MTFPFANHKKLRFESLEDRRLLTAFDVLEDTDTGDETELFSLSWAIDQANKAGAGSHEIRISASLTTLELTNQLPDITISQLTIDGNNTILVGNNGFLGGFQYDGAASGAGSLTIRDIKLTGFQNSPIHVRTLGDDDDVTITNTEIFSNTTAAIAFSDVPSGDGVVLIEDNFIYDNDAGISIGFTGPGTPPTTTQQSRIRNNDLGVDRSSVIMPNEDFGIQFGKGATKFSVSQNNIFTSDGSGVAYASDVGDDIILTLGESGTRIAADLGGVPLGGTPHRSQRQWNHRHVESSCHCARFVFHKLEWTHYVLIHGSKRPGWVLQCRHLSSRYDCRRLGEVEFWEWHAG